MLPSQFPRPLRLGLYALASAILLYLCLAPRDRLPEPGVGDKTEHAIAWFILVVVGYALAPRRRWAIPAYAVVLGAAVEVLQRLFVWFGRDGDIVDFLVDLLGVAVAVAGAELLRRRRARVIDAA